MTRFLQFHALTVYPPSNPNRDDSNRPKTVRYGFTERLRISSQSLKRAWRVSDQFLNQIGTRLTKDSLSAQIDKWLQNPNDKLKSQVIDLVTKAPSKEKEKDEKNKVIFLTHAEMERIKEVLKTGNIVEVESIYSNDDISADVAMFGRMMTHQTAHNVEAAVQVSHAFTVHAGSVEDDFFTAVDELKPKEDTGAGFLDSRAFGGGGVYYLYVCVDVDLLLKNLNNNQEAAQQAIQGLVNAMTKVAPSGMQNSFGSRVICEYILAEYGMQQPRSLATAFLQAVYGEKHDSPLDIAKRRLEQRRDEIDRIYGKVWEEYRVMGSSQQEHSTNLEGIIQFCTSKITPVEGPQEQPQE
jgi:CRISPR system Cascade subunit CasC